MSIFQHDIINCVLTAEERRLLLLRMPFSLMALNSDKPCRCSPVLLTLPEVCLPLLGNPTVNESVTEGGLVSSSPAEDLADWSGTDSLTVNDKPEETRTWRVKLFFAHYASVWLETGCLSGCMDQVVAEAMEPSSDR